MIALVDANSHGTTFQYDNRGRASEQQLANGSKATYTYDSAGRLSRLANFTSIGTMISSFEYQYDSVGNRTSVVESNADRVTWSYDNTYQLTREERSGANAYDVTHTYDAVGNRQVTEDSGARTTYTYDNANQLATSVDSTGTTTYTYDTTGNLQLQQEAGGRTTNTWDAGNRLTLAETPTAVNTMTYRADGLRVQKQDSAGTSNFIWDGQNILTETDGGDSTQAVYTLQPLQFGNLISQRRGATSHFFHFDALDSTDRLTSTAEATTDSYLYQAYGQLVTSTGSTTNPFLWVGRLGYFEDAELEQYYVRARHYKPVLTRWLSQDPIGYRSGDNNLYRYVGGNPTKAVDPTGKTVYCGLLDAECDEGVITIPVYADSSVAAAILALGGFSSGCVTLPSGVHCTGSCQEAKDWNSGDNQDQPLLNHEACHYCILKYHGLCAYLLSAGGSPDACVGNEVDSTPNW